MEFMNRGNRPTQSTNAGLTSPLDSGSGNRKKGGSGFSGLKLASVALLFSATILVVALLWFVVLGSPSSESKHIDKDRMQAVFLNGGQVYFGHIQDLNDDFIRLTGIYYLRINQQVQPENSEAQTTGSPVLVRLGCELHRPKDEMLINRDQVLFWENLKDEDTENTVPGAVKKYVAANPNGQDCAAETSNTGTGTGTTEEDADQ